MNAVNQIPKGGIIFSEGSVVAGVCLVVKGRVQISNKGMKAVVSTGSFLGISDLKTGKYQVNYQAYDDVVVYAFPITTEDSIEKIFAYNKDYASLIVISMNKYIKELAKGYRSFENEVSSLYTYLSSAYTEYRSIAKKSGYNVPVNEGLEELEEYQSPNKVSEDLMEYYCACAGVSMDVRKAFYQNPVICLHHIKEQAAVIRELIFENMEHVFYMSDLLASLISDEESCMFRGAMKLALNLKDASQKRIVEKMIDGIVDHINNIENAITEHSGMEVHVDRDYMETAYYKLISGEDMLGADLVLEAEGEITEESMEEFENSLMQILEYSGISEEKRAEFEEYVQQYIELKDKFSTEDFARNLRRKISKEYYEIYLKIFRKAYKDEKKPRIIELFLNYGYMDERLLTPEQLLELCHLQPDFSETEPCHVYSMYDWLCEIYEGRKDPSKSEMDMDYIEALREKKKNKEVTEEEAKRLETDVEAKLEYEIRNMLTYNNRILSGQATAFIPILHEQSFVSSVRKAQIASAEINAAMNRILQVDYSAFYRQSVYSDVEHGITKEYIMKEVFPDVILLPTCGSNGIMWQDISGRKRTTPGRFLLPAFCEVSLEDTLIRMIGRFRWELCRTIQGVSWNDVKVKSITSEYMDYLQFYKKNHDLSEEKKEKLKVQIQKSRGNSREVFVSDYFAWVKFESQGSIRLNKPVREILSTYCPFRKELREKLIAQPMFAESYTRFQRDTMKIVRENGVRRRGLEKAGVQEIPQEILDTYDFYENM